MDNIAIVSSPSSSDGWRNARFRNGQEASLRKSSVRIVLLRAERKKERLRNVCLCAAENCMVRNTAAHRDAVPSWISDRIFLLDSSRERAVLRALRFLLGVSLKLSIVEKPEGKVRELLKTRIRRRIYTLHWAAACAREDRCQIFFYGGAREIYKHGASPPVAGSALFSAACCNA